MKLGSNYCLAAVAALLVLVAGLQAFGADAVVEETAISQNGIWRIRLVGGEEREIAVPSAWERPPVLRDVHEATCTRDFDGPGSLGGQRVLLRFDAVGDATAVLVNGQQADSDVGRAHRLKLDITALVTIPSTGTRSNPRRLICELRFRMRRSR